MTPEELKNRLENRSNQENERKQLHGSFRLYLNYIIPVSGFLQTLYASKLFPIYSQRHGGNKSNSSDSRLLFSAFVE